MHFTLHNQVFTIDVQIKLIKIPIIELQEQYFKYQANKIKLSLTLSLSLFIYYPHYNHVELIEI